MVFQIQLRKTLMGMKPALMLCDPAPCGRGSEDLHIEQQARGYRSILSHVGPILVVHKPTCAFDQTRQHATALRGLMRGSRSPRIGSKRARLRARRSFSVIRAPP